MEAEVDTRPTSLIRHDGCGGYVCWGILFKWFLLRRPPDGTCKIYVVEIRRWNPCYLNVLSVSRINPLGQFHAHNPFPRSFQENVAAFPSRNHMARCAFSSERRHFFDT